MTSFSLNMTKEIGDTADTGKAHLLYSKLQNMSDFNTILNSHGYLALLVPKTSLVVWYFIIDLILSKFHNFLALFKLKSTAIFICFYYLIISSTKLLELYIEFSSLQI